MRYSAQLQVLENTSIAKVFPQVSMHADCLETLFIYDILLVLGADFTRSPEFPSWEGRHGRWKGTDNSGLDGLVHTSVSRAATQKRDSH